MDHESVGLRAPYILKYFERAEHHRELGVYSDLLCAAMSTYLATQSKAAGASYNATEGSAWETTTWKTMTRTTQWLIVIPDETAEEDWAEEQATS